jgi:hypothetical protein
VGRGGSVCLHDPPRYACMLFSFDFFLVQAPQGAGCMYWWGKRLLLIDAQCFCGVVVTVVCCNAARPNPPTSLPPHRPHMHVLDSDARSASSCVREPLCDMCARVVGLLPLLLSSALAEALGLQFYAEDDRQCIVLDFLFHNLRFVLARGQPLGCGSTSMPTCALVAWGNGWCVGVHRQGRVPEVGTDGCLSCAQPPHPPPPPSPPPPPCPRALPLPGLPCPQASHQSKRRHLWASAAPSWTVLGRQ